MQRKVIVHAPSGSRVSLDIHQFLAGGMKTEYSNSDGVAIFHLDVDTFAEVTVYVDGQERLSRRSIADEFYT